MTEITPEVLADAAQEIITAQPAGRHRKSDATVQDELAATLASARDGSDLRSWSRDDLMMTVRAAGILWDSDHASAADDILTSHQIYLLERAAHAYLPGFTALGPVHAASCGLQGSGLDKSCTCKPRTVRHADGSYAGTP